MSTMFRSTKRSFYHGLGCEMIKLEILALKEIQKQMIQERQCEKRAFKQVMKRKNRGEDTSNVNFKLFALSGLGYVSEIRELERRIAFLKDSYHDLYSVVYTKTTGKEPQGGPSAHEYNLRWGQSQDNRLSERDIARGVKGWGSPSVVPGKMVDVSTIDTSKLSPIVLFAKKGPKYVQEE